MSILQESLVSIIIPVYNAEQFLHRCIDSILAQTYANFEVILVDDGAKDSSGVICDEYAAKDSRIKVIHIPNGGVSNARNTGLDAATGEYMIFVDSDDWIMPDHLEQLLPIGEEDWVCGGIRFLKHSVLDRTESSPAAIVCKEQWLSNFSEFWGKYANCSPCRCSYKTEIIRKHNLHFQEGISIGEDELFNLNYITHCNTLRYVTSCTYCYETGGAGSLIGSYHPDRLLSCHKAATTIEQITKQPEYIMRWQYWHLAIAHLEKWRKQSPAEKKGAIIVQLKNCFREPFFRACIPYMRQHGSLDQKIETFFMYYHLHKLYKPCYQIILCFYKIKQFLIQR